MKLIDDLYSNTFIFQRVRMKINMVAFAANILVIWFLMKKSQSFYKRNSTYHSLTGRETFAKLNAKSPLYSIGWRLEHMCCSPPRHISGSEDMPEGSSIWHVFTGTFKITVSNFVQLGKQQSHIVRTEAVTPSTNWSFSVVIGELSVTRLFCIDKVSSVYLLGVDSTVLKWRIVKT